MNLADSYARAQRRILALVDEQNADTEVPTCPGWTVKDLVAHLASFFPVARSDDNHQAAFSPGWGDREVKEREGLSLQQSIDEWNAAVKDADDLFGSNLGMVAVADVLAHEQDIRTALNEPRARDDESMLAAVDLALSFLDHKVKGADLPALQIVTDDFDRSVGEGEPKATLRADTFELFRALHGRRTVEQVRAMDWEGDPEPWMSSFFLFGPTDRQVETS
jgi:uncharacterized protein (TIGR03083 family)